MAIVLPFKRKETRKKKAYLSDIFPNEEVKQYHGYLLSSNHWVDTYKSDSIYYGYPNMEPCSPPLKEMVWYVNDKENYGVWVLNYSDLAIEENTDLEWGWSPFIRKSTAPIHEPYYLGNSESRQYVTWVVDTEGFGQYGLVRPNGEVFVPYPRPAEWINHNI